MKLVALISGGKDSLFNMLQCIAAGHEIVALANIEPDSKEELDSYMYQSVGHQAVSLIAVALGLPIYRQKTRGIAVCTLKTYRETIQDEVEDMLQLLQKVKKDIHIEGVAVGAIASDYQRTRVENVCNRLGLKSFAYLWRRNQSELLQEMIDADLDAIIIKVASIGLNPDIHLGMHIRDMKAHLIDINKKYGVNICGEGGEYETLTIDCPLFHRKIAITEYENLILSNDAFAPVGFLNVKNAILKQKVWESDDPVQSLQTRLAFVKSVVKDPYKYIEDCVDEVTLNIFPQHNTVATNEILPFPFEPSFSESKSSTNLAEYWKKSPMSQQPHSSHRVSFSPSTLSAFDTTTSNLNYSTGWCCIGNITAVNIQEAMGYLQRHLERTKYEFSDVVFVNLYLRDMSDFHSVNKIYSQQMSDVLPPARACVAVPLPSEVNLLIIVMAHKYVSKSQKAINANCTLVKDAVHVQSISHWAPANIGPYSQCVRVGGLYYVAGQIPLIPGTMEILNKPIVYQCRLTLRHVCRVLQAMNGSLNLTNIFQAVCYVTSEEIAYDLFHLWLYVTRNETATVAVLVVSGLPKNAQLEWEVIACDFDNPRVLEFADVIGEFNVQTRRCVYLEPYTSSFTCRISPIIKEATRKPKELTPETLKAILKHCFQFIKKEVKNIGLHLCTLKLFYKYSNQILRGTVADAMRTFDFDHKVVASGVPVVAFCDPGVIMTITGVCH